MPSPSIFESASPDLPLLAFVDLDDSLFRSERKAKGPLGRPVTVRQDGRPYSYMGPVQERLWSALLATADHVIPTTARTLDAFRRVDLRFESWAILSLGAVILTPEGEADPDWEAEVTRRLAALDEGVQTLAARLRRQVPGLDPRVVEDFGRGVYLSLRPEADQPSIEAALERLLPAVEPLVPPDWVLSPHERDAVLRPRALGKAEALRWLREVRLPGPALTVGLGDRGDDLDFMAECDYALTPTGSQIFTELRR